MTKYILVSGGVVSGIGKGVIGVLFYSSLFAAADNSSLIDRPIVEDNGIESHRYQDRSVHEHRCWNDEADRAWCTIPIPAQNWIANQRRHAGEVYVLNDGGEVDLDLGNYERYLNVTLSRDNNITTGKIYRQVIEKEVL